ncbi:DUF2721 domain-containing protein [Psychroflexus salis]|uniref:Membrane protein n=1 Tax=Psychroflexus salis TaxID=1526574 RepID=A0A917E781_9FLAO|nr:DUF2721 domain-containing protein [Psychroflexus salis]GGE11700.1 membrane protein [Psychroflexus salis]
MEISLTTPALLFPAISLLLLAYTNRFLTIAGLIRNLYKQYKAAPNQNIKAQITNLKKRVSLIKNMQLFGIVSLLLCVVSMFALYESWIDIGSVIFGISLVLLMISLVLSIIEIQISVKALNIQISDMESGHRAAEDTKNQFVN